MEHVHVRNIAFDIVLTLLTCFLYNFYIQYKQCEAVNDMLGQPKYSFVSWLLLTIITCGLYHIYHEYRKSSDIAECNGKPADSAGLTAILLTIFGMSIILDAIQQGEINSYYGNKSL